MMSLIAFCLCVVGISQVHACIRFGRSPSPPTPNTPSTPSTPTTPTTPSTPTTTTTPSSNGCSNVNIISRSQWRARAPKSTTTITVPVSEFFIHHTAGQSCNSVSSCSSVVRGIQNYHMDDTKQDAKNWSDIGYSFLVGGDGNVYEGRGWTRVGAHTVGHKVNHNYIAFAGSMIGTFTSQLPTQQALTAVQNLIKCGVDLGKISSSYKLSGHRDVSPTQCPGDALYNHIKTWPNYSP